MDAACNSGSNVHDGYKPRHGMRPLRPSRIGISVGLRPTRNATVAADLVRANRHQCGVTHVEREPKGVLAQVRTLHGQIYRLGISISISPWRPHCMFGRICLLQLRVTLSVRRKTGAGVESYIRGENATMVYLM